MTDHRDHNDRSDNLRLALFSVGITLDDPKPAHRQATVAAVPEADPAARARIRRILAAKVPRHHIDWMTASCPSIAHAMAYKHPAPIPPKVSIPAGEPAINSSTPPVTAEPLDLEITE